MRIGFMLASVAAATLASPLAAQIKPLPKAPLAPKLQVQQPAAPTLTVKPATVVYAPMGGGPTDFEVRTAGGTRAVTLRLEVDGVRAHKFQLVDPPAASNTLINTQLAPGAMATQPGSIMQEASSVRKMIRWAGNESVSGSLTADHRVTVIATDSGGREARHSFTVKFTKARGAPQIDLFKSRTGAGYSFLDSPDAMPVNAMTLANRAGSAVNFSSFDPGSEIICVYGSYRYACDSFSAADDKDIRVDVPDINRGKAVRLIFKNPYGEASMNVNIVNGLVQGMETERTSTGNVLPHSIETDEVPGTVDDELRPGQKGTSTEALNSGPNSCGKLYFTWNDVKIDSPRFDGPIVRGISASIKSKPAVGSRMTLNNLPVFKFDIGPGLSPVLLYNVTYSRTAHIGECAEKRR